MHHGRACFQGLRRVNYRGQQLVVDYDLLQRVGGCVNVFGDDDGDGLAHVADLAFGQYRVPGRGNIIDFVGQTGRQLGGQTRKVAGGYDRRHARHGGRRGRIDGAQHGMGMGTAQHQGVQHSRQLHIVDIRREPRQQAVVLKPPD